MLNGVYAAQAKKRPGARGRARVGGELRGVERRGEGHLPDPGVRHPARAREQRCLQVQLHVRVARVRRSYIGALGVSHSILIPGHKKINALLLEMEQGPPPAGGPPPQVAQIQEIGKRRPARRWCSTCPRVILLLMIWQRVGAAAAASRLSARRGAIAGALRPGLRRRAGSPCPLDRRDVARRALHEPARIGGQVVHQLGKRERASARSR